MSSRESWISVVDWRKYQHYQKGEHPPWVKVYTRLLHDDEYMSLSPGRALMLHRLWLEYAQTRCRLRADTRSLSRRLGLRVRQDDLEALSHAGFIEVVSRLGLVDGYEGSSENLALASRATDTEVDREVLKASIPQSGSKTTGGLGDTPEPPEDFKESDNEHEHERELVRFSDDNGMSPVADSVDELREQWSL